jgi:hypothetical protein
LRPLNSIQQFYNKYKDAVLFNKNLLLADTVSLFASSFLAQTFFYVVNSNIVTVSIFTAVVEYSIDTPIFFLLFYIDHRRRYMDNNGIKLKIDFIHLFGLFTTCDILYVIIKMFMQIQLMSIGGIFQPYQAALFSSLISWAIYLILINITMKVSHIFSSHEMSFYYVLILVLSLATSILFFVGSDRKNAVDDIMTDCVALVALSASIIIVFRQSIIKHILSANNKAFLFIMIGLALWTSAEITFTYYQLVLDIKNPFPTVADAFWLSGYTMFIMALYKILLVNFRKTNFAVTTGVQQIDIRRHKYGISTITGAAVAITILSYTFASILAGSNLLKLDLIGITDFIISVAYPVLDIIMLVPALLIVWGLRRSDPVFTHFTLLSSFVIFSVIGDSGFAFSQLVDFAIFPLWIWDIFFISAYICMAASLFWYNKFSIITINAEKGRKAKKSNGD